MDAVDRLRGIEEKRASLMARLATLDPLVLDAHPFPGQWSISQIIEHLVLSEAEVVGDFSRLADLEEGRRSLRQRALYLVVWCVLRYDIAVKVPSRGMKPRGDRSLADLGAKWEENHHRLRAFVAGLDRRGFRRAIFRHPVSGPMTVRQGITLLEAHLDRHTRQIQRLERVLAEETKPRGG